MHILKNNIHGKQKTSLKANSQNIPWKDMESTLDLPSSCNCALAVALGWITSVLGTKAQSTCRWTNIEGQE